MNLENYLFWDLNNVKNKENLGGLKAKLHKPKDVVNVECMSHNLKMAKDVIKYKI